MGFGTSTAWAAHVWGCRKEKKNSRGKENGGKEEGRHKSKERGVRRREGAWELTGCEVALVHAANSACESYTTVHLPMVYYPAWQGAGTAWAGERNVLNNSPKQQMWPMNRLVIMQKEGLEKKSWRLRLQLGWAQVFLVYFILPPRKGREVICMQIEDLSCKLKEEGCCLDREELCRCKKTQTPAWMTPGFKKLGHVPPMNVKAPRILGTRHATTHHLELLLTV